jgi:DNA-binding NtrC family response regulator
MGHDFRFQVVPLAEAVAEPQVSRVNEKQIVLVVDDEPLIVDSLAAILATKGFEVLKAYNGTSALEVALERPPHLLLTDVAMPGMNGIELAMAVASAMPECRVLLFSAHASTLDLGKARMAGYDFPLMAKPLHPVEMLKRVSQSLQEAPRNRVQRPTAAEESHSIWSMTQATA